MELFLSSAFDTHLVTIQCIIPTVLPNSMPFTFTLVIGLAFVSFLVIFNTNITYSSEAISSPPSLVPVEKYT